MPKLYYTPTSCGGSNFMAAVYAGVDIEAEQVVLATHKTASGADFYSINPKGNVPTIVLDDGTILNENAATLQWIADQKPGTVAPPLGSQQRYKLIEALSYISGELHSSIGPLFLQLSPEINTFVRDRVAKKLQYVNDHLLGDRNFVMGEVTVADFYLYIILTWSGYVKIDLSPYPHLVAFVERMSNLEAIKKANARMHDTTNPPKSTLA